MLFHPKPSSLSPAWFFLFYKLMKEIQLTQGKVALVDDEDFEYLNQWKWYVNKWNSGFYAVRNVRINKKYVGYVSMHRLLTNNEDKILITDHINGNTLDNRKSNLRICNYSQNNSNRKIHINNKCGYKGVRFIIKSNKYQAGIWHNKKFYYLGLFTDPAQAGKAYNEAAIKYHGAFAKLNII